MALIIKQARASGMDLPIITSSSLVEPTATALFDPAELANVCAETPSAPEARGTPEMKAWADSYKQRFGIEPDGLALGQYDGVMMALKLIGEGADTAEKLREAFHKASYKGVAMTYQSDGEGDMAHDADIVCWDGSSRVPNVAAHYAGEEMVLK
jgi:branched-chain amino acid transport system substrate-binding protein